MGCYKFYQKLQRDTEKSFPEMAKYCACEMNSRYAENSSVERRNHLKTICMKKRILKSSEARNGS